MNSTKDYDQRTVLLPLAEYGQLINTATRDFAVTRIGEQKRDKRKRVEEEGEEGKNYLVEVLEEESGAGGSRSGHVEN